MASTDIAESIVEDEPQFLRKRSWGRAFRLWSGMVLMVFVTMHLLNHALAIFGTGVAEDVQAWRVMVWRSVPGTALLYGAFGVHVALALARIAKRRTWRMPRDEALQIGLGLLIPLLLIDHVVGTRLMSVLFSLDDTYSKVMPRLWNGRPVYQTLLLLASWTHGCLGLYHAYRWKPWFRRFGDAALIVAVFVPTLALAGFVAGSREAIARIGITAPFPSEVRDSYLSNVVLFHTIFVMILTLVVGVLMLRYIQRHNSGIISLRYVGHGSVRLSRGTSVLEASRINRIPHPARCGGRGRCTTCRVLIVSSEGAIPAPGPAERDVLEKIAAPSQVRLACQLRPQGDMAVQILLPFLAAAEPAEMQEDSLRWGAEHVVTVLFVNMRAFNLLAQRQFPHDLVILLNRFAAEMTQAVEAHGGQVNTYLTDGLMAVFGLDGRAGAGSAEAIATAQAMLKVVRALDREMAGVLAIPLRIGIGIHTGPAIVARFGDPGHGQAVGVIGQTVTIADRLEAATKTSLTDCLISQDALKASGLGLATAGQREIAVPGCDAPVIAHAMKDAPALPSG